MTVRSQEDGAHLVLSRHAAGKERTGIMAGIVLSLLGVDDEVIVADYALSGQAMDRLMAWGRANSIAQNPARRNAGCGHRVPPGDDGAVPRSAAARRRQRQR